jgi:hypothetical protein
MSDGDSSDDEEWELASKSLEHLISQLEITPSSSTAEMIMLPKRKLLVLLDMNGTLLLRSKNKLAGKVHDVKVLGNYCYFRNGAREFCHWLTSMNADIDICFYTSMKAASGVPLATQLVGDSSIYLFDQTYNKRDPAGENSWSMMRDLVRLWSTEDSPAYGHSERDTLMIDDSFAKMREYPDNVFLVPEYTEEYIATKKSAEDGALELAKGFLLELLLKWKRCDCEDIRPLVSELRG